MNLNANQKVMQQNIFEKLFSNEKKVSQFAVGFSVLAHIALVIIMSHVNLETVREPAAAPENYVDLGYQQFDEVPQVVETKSPVIKDIPDVPDKAEPTQAAQEMQDQASEVAGLQKESVQPVKVATTTSTNTTQVPYYKIKPKYPKDALASGLEGHVMIELDIEQDGSVDNIKVTGGDKLNVFETEARRAVAKWKYKPFVDQAGSPIKKEKYMVRVDFKLQDQAANN